MIKTMFKKILACILAASCLLIPDVQALTAQDGLSGRKIKVGVLNNTTFAYQDGDGTWFGIDVECMIKIAQKAGLDIEFVDSSNDPAFMENLDRGTYDIVADVVKTEARASRYLFSDEAIGNTNNTLTVRADDDRWDYGNIIQLSSMKIGVISTYANNAEFRQWCVEHSVTPQIVEYQSLNEMSSALKGGQLDGAVYSAVYGNEYATAFRPIMKFLPEYYYYAFRKDDYALKNAIDQALSQIIAENQDYLESLRSRYNRQFKTDVLPFSIAERNYISQHQAVTVAVLAGDEPYYGTDAKGEPRGIIPDYFKLLGGYSGLSFTYVAYPDQAAAIAAVTAGRTDLLGLFSSGLVEADRDGLVLTGCYATINNMLMTRAGTDIAAVGTIAIKHRSAASLLSTISQTLAQANFVECETAQDCFTALASGRVDATILGMPSATYLINQNNSESYSISPLPGVTLDLCGAATASSMTLLSIIDKSIIATKSSFSGIITSDTLPQGSWRNIITRIPPMLTALTVCLLVVLVCGLVWALAVLRRRQKERTAVLAAQADTERQRMQVEALNRSAEERTRFFSNISHDMRTPLNAITGYIRLAQKDGLSPVQRRDYLSKAESSSTLLLDLIDDTLTISKVSNGKMELHPQPCRTADLVAVVAGPIRESAVKKGIVFSVDTTAMADTVISVDRLSFEKVILNLLNNAVKYTPAGGHVWLTVVQREGHDGMLDFDISVRDDGIGISPEFMPHVFEPFAQERRHGYESVGTGLGLSIVKQLVDLMGGTIDVSSTKNQGTVFTLHLSFPQADVPAEMAVKHPTHRSFDLTGHKVLLVEDNALNREIAVALLTDKGLHVVVANNGQVGLDIFRSSAINEFSAPPS